VPNMVMKELAVTMPKLLEEKLLKIKVKAETMVLKEKNQARYFYAKLRDVRQDEELRKDKNRMYGIRKRISPNPISCSSSEFALATDDCLSMASGSTKEESTCDSRKSRTETIEKLKSEPLEKRGSIGRTRSYKNMFEGQNSSRL
jgi:hypothetical protein